MKMLFDYDYFAAEFAITFDQIDIFQRTEEQFEENILHLGKLLFLMEKVLSEKEQQDMYQLIKSLLSSDESESCIVLLKKFARAYEEGSPKRMRFKRAAARKTRGEEKEERYQEVMRRKRKKGRERQEIGRRRTGKRDLVMAGSD